MLYWVYVVALGARHLELLPVPEFYKLIIIYLGVVVAVINNKWTENEIFDYAIKTPEFPENKCD